MKSKLSLQTSRSSFPFRSVKPRTTRSICTTSWTCHSPWTTINKNWPNSEICSVSQYIFVFVSCHILPVEENTRKLVNSYSKIFKNRLFRCLKDCFDIWTAKKMSNITENFQLGFGSFVDKKTMPYVSTVPEKSVTWDFYVWNGVVCASVSCRGFNTRRTTNRSLSWKK